MTSRHARTSSVRWLVRGGFVAIGAVAANACVTTSSSTSPAGTGGSAAVICPYYGGPTNLACPADEQLVCGFSGVPTGCCPTQSPYYCQSTQLCYPTPASAGDACGLDCQRCTPFNPNNTGSSSGSSSSSSSGATMVCSAGMIFSPPPAGGSCPENLACSNAPFSCIPPSASAQGLTCCCSSDGTLCIGCGGEATCGGPISGSEVSCCLMQ